MQHQRQWQVPFLCLVVFAAAVCGAKTPTNTYADFVARKTGAAVQSESYQSEPREFEHTCLKEISFKNCMPLGVSDYFEWVPSGLQQEDCSCLMARNVCRAAPKIILSR
jgi:hypothetical protein